MQPQSAAPRTKHSAQVVDIDGSERVFSCGKTGSGKSFWAAYMLAALPRVVLIDQKHSETFDAYKWDEPNRESAHKLTSGRAVRVRITELEPALAYMALAYEAGDCIVYVDEVLLMAPKGGRPPVELENIWTRGRERGVGGWAATQRPVYMPLWLISESEWTVCFRLRLDDDRKRMSESMGEEVLEPIHDEHGFFISRDNWDGPNYYGSVDTTMRLKG